MKRQTKWMVGGTVALSVAGIAYLNYGANTQVQPTTSLSSAVIQSSESSSVMASVAASTNEGTTQKKQVIVGAVFADGYLQKHGNHYHFVKGQPPKDAIYEQQLTKHRGSSEEEEGLGDTGDHYVFDPKDIVSENAQGYVVRHGDHFHFIFKQDLRTNNGRVANVTHETASHNDHYTFNPADVVSEDANGYVVRHGDHFHYIYKNSTPNIAVKPATPSVTPTPNVTHETASHDDHYTFNPADVVSEDANGYVVRHGDHFHYIYKKDTPNVATTPATPSVTPAPNVTHETTSPADHYTFNPSDVVSEDANGYVVRHGDHFHYIYKKDTPNVAAKPATPSVTPTPDVSHETKPETTAPKYSADIEAKIQYIMDSYGVVREAIQVINGFFVFNEPAHKFDPTHIHPYAIPVDLLEIPVRTNQPEIDFRNELRSVARRMGMKPYQIGIKDGYFVIPHGDHDHFVKIQTQGAEAYLANRLPDITGELKRGEFNKQTVLDRVAQLEKRIDDKKYNDLEASRLKDALMNFTDHLAQGANSTDGYLTMLQQFEKQYIDKENADSTEETEEDKKFNERVNQMVSVINSFDLNRYTVTKEQLLERVYTIGEQRDSAALTKMQQYLQAIQATQDRPGIVPLQYVDLFMAHLDDRAVNNALKTKMADLITQTYEAALFNPKALRPLFMELIETKEALQKAHQTAITEDTTTLGESYQRFNQTTKAEIADFLKGSRDIIGETEKIASIHESKADGSTEKTDATPTEKAMSEAPTKKIAPEAPVEKQADEPSANEDATASRSSAAVDAQSTPVEDARKVLAETSENNTPEAAGDKSPETEKSETPEVEKNKAVETEKSEAAPESNTPSTETAEQKAKRLEKEKLEKQQATEPK